VLRPGAVHAGQVDGSGPAETMTADVSLYATDGAPIAVLEGLHLKRADRNALLRLGRRGDPDDWLYTVDWRELPAATFDEAREALPFPLPTELAVAAGEHVDRLRETHDLDHYQGLLDELEALSTDYIIAALDELGVRFEADHHFALDALGVAGQHRALLDQLIDFLAADGILAADGEGWRVVRAPVVDVGEERWSALLERYPLGRGELTVTRRCGEQLAGALTGDVDHLQLIFPGGSLDAAEDMYQLSPFAHFFNSLLSESIAEAVGQSGASRPDPGRPLRVIEIGAGTGGTTSYVLPRLPADNTEYTYTDISPHFLTRAREKFAAHPFVEYRTLDIEGDLGVQGFDGDRYDVVVAANVLHATADLRHTFANVARLLAPGGLLAMVEMVRPQRFISITFGLTEGWWKFTDTALRPSSLLLDRDGWRDFLADQGFVEPRGLPAIGADAPSALAVQAALLAAAPRADDAEQALPPERRRWLVVGDHGGVGDRFAESIRARGGSAVVGLAGETFRDLGGDRFELDPADPDDWARLVAKLPDGVPDGFPDGVLHLWSLDEPAPDAAASATMERRLGSALLLARTLVEAGASTRLWLVTRGAQAAGDIAPDAEQAPLWGFAKALALEHPELHASCLDLDPSPVADPASALLDEMLTTDAEDQVAVRGRARLGARLVRWTPPAPAMAHELTFDEGGALDLLCTREIERRSPAPDEVEIRVHATGLNFKDVLNVLGMYPGDPGPLGGECAGVVVAVGSEVTDVSVGDAVVAVASGSFRSHVTCPATFVAPKPPEMSFAEAAALLIANVTADFALRHVGRIASGERVLIHAAAGGVGLAAVDLARRAGAEIFATAGSDEKRAFLASLGVEHIYDSRSLDFADAIATDTGGEGVDLVLNSLAGDFVQHSMALLRDGGRFLEIGKSDHLDDAAAQGLGRGIEYHVIDWGETSLHDPQLIASIVSDVVSAAADHVLRPLPIEVFPLAEAEAAFRFMAQARHIGKVVVTQPEAATERAPAPIVADATYLVTGGLTGLGLLTAEHLCERGARHLALIGRRPPSESARAQIAAIEANGVRVEVVQGDVSVRADLARALDIVESAMPPLRGVFHSAGALDDAGLTQQTWERFATVLRAKVDGARLLEELTDGDQIDHFVLYSSIASLLGSRGQTNHAAANAYLDALAHRRAALGRHGLSINWGAWDEIGAAVERGVVGRTEERGIGIIPPDDGLAILDRLMDGAVPQVGVSPLDWSVVLQTSRPGGPPPYLADHIEAARSHTVAPSPAPVADIGAKLQAAPPHRRHAMLLEFVREQSAHVLALSPDNLDARTPLGDLGLDSLMAVELRNSLGASLSMDRPIPATLVFDYPTIEAITDFLAGPVLDPLAGDERDGDDGDGGHGGVEAPAPAGTSPGSSLESLFDDMENLSDEEIDRRLAERSGT
jgi:NADPH:quinone reductase-like Zn-dependent oxidoreductase/SAM-dependent methyltransferase/acyl carrier protein